MGQTVLITGTSSGFGRLAAQTLAKKGHRVFATMREIGGRNRGAADELSGSAKAEGLDVNVVEMDVGSDDSVANAVEGVLREAGHIDVLVSNAGVGMLGLEETITTDQLRQLFDANVIGTHRLVRAVLPSMRSRGRGLVIALSSGLGRIVLPALGAYAASKAAVEALIEAYRYELKPTGIEACIVQPGTYPTKFQANMSVGTDQDRASGYGPLANVVGAFQTNLAHMATGQNPQDVAEAILRLVEAPQGKRPDRVVCGSGLEGVVALNDVHRQVQSAALGMFGMGELAG